LDGEGVELGAHQDGGTGSIFQEGDDAVTGAAVGVFAEVFGEGEAGLAKLAGEAGGRVLFLAGELRMGVEVLVEGRERGRLAGGERGEIDGLRGQPWGRGGEEKKEFHGA